MAYEVWAWPLTSLVEAEPFQGDLRRASLEHRDYWVHRFGQQHWEAFLREAGWPCCQAYHRGPRDLQAFRDFRERRQEDFRRAFLREDSFPVDLMEVVEG